MHHLPAGEKMAGGPGGGVPGPPYRGSAPTREELAAWAERLPVKRLWNTSGQKYRQLGLSQKLPGMSLDEQLDLLCTDGMLVKRPVLAGEGFVLTGFKEAEWAAALGKD